MVLYVALPVSAPDPTQCYWQGQRIAKGEDMASLCVYVEQDECRMCDSL